MTHDHAPPPPRETPAQTASWTLERQHMFCETLAACGVVSQAADSVGLSRRSAYAFRSSAKGRAFGRVWDEAREIACRAMVDEAVALAFDGRVVQVLEDGAIVAERRHNNPARLLRAVERLRSDKLLGDETVVAAARDFEHCLDLLGEGRAFPKPRDDLAARQAGVFAFFKQMVMGKEGVDYGVPEDGDPSAPSRHAGSEEGDGGDEQGWDEQAWEDQDWPNQTETEPDAPEPDAPGYAHPGGRHRWSPAIQREFCEALARYGNVDKACRTVGKGRTGAYALRQQAHGRAFAIAWDAALLVVSEEMIDTALEMAREGSVDSIYRHGKLVRVRRTLAVDTMLDTIARVMAIRSKERPWPRTDFATSLARLASGEAQAEIEAGVEPGFHYTDAMVHEAVEAFLDGL